MVLQDLGVNEMREREITMKRVVCIVLAGLLSTSLSNGSNKKPGHTKEWMKLLVSDNKTEREQVMRASFIDRKEKIEYLISVAESPLRKGERFYDMSTARNIAIHLLGEMRAKEAVLALIDNLLLKEGQDGVASERFVAAEEALVKIGLPSIPALIQVIEKHGISWPVDRKSYYDGKTHIRLEPLKVYSELGDMCLKTMVRIKGWEESLWYMKHLCKKGKDKKIKIHYRRAIA